MARPTKRTRCLPPLVALRAFEAVGSAGSMRAAAEELAVSPTVISRHLDNLEKRLGVTLIAPKGRSIELTEAGVRFHAEVARAFDLIDAATGELLKPVRKPLLLWCWPGLAVMRLLQRLPALEALLPDYAIHFHPTLARPDLRRHVADAEIFYRTAEEPRVPGIVEIELARPRVMPVASPALLSRHAPSPQDPELLFELPWIHEVSADQWRAWLQAAGLLIDGRAQDRLQGVRLWHAHLAIGAAQLGQGVALANELLVETELAEGRLVEIGHSEVRLGTYVLAMRAESLEEAPMRALTDWLQRSTVPATLA